MMIKFLARGTGSAAAAADYLTREQNLAPEQDQDQDQDRDPDHQTDLLPRAHNRPTITPRTNNAVGIISSHMMVL